ncbi:hypothetical protein X798_06105 [Onchocerca flexuosa]|uniref:Cystatin domain-containing protein n=1 Tax=Onchocerca flexuosa TaxID=387005 RepID=A0A238BNC6_9BILA|nr:hypothetical protein X798_06105 [Onchocerca flexuosa]
MLRWIVLFAIFVSFSNAQYENDPDVKDVINDSLMIINQKMGNKFLHRLQKILKAHVLVVESTIYSLMIRLYPTTCKVKFCKYNREKHATKGNLQIPDLPLFFTGSQEKSNEEMQSGQEAETEGRFS